MRTPRLPHGPGFSFVDQFEIVEGEKEVRARKYLDPSLPVFADHFPGHPIFPAVLLVEMGAQSAGILWGHLLGKIEDRFALAQVVQFKVIKSVPPGITLHTTAELESDFGSLAQFRIQILHDDELLAEGRIVLASGAVPA